MFPKDLLWPEQAYGEPSFFLLMSFHGSWPGVPGFILSQWGLFFTFCIALLMDSVFSLFLLSSSSFLSPFLVGERAMFLCMIGNIDMRGTGGTRLPCWAWTNPSLKHLRNPTQERNLSNTRQRIKCALTHNPASLEDEPAWFVTYRRHTATVVQLRCHWWCDRM